MRVYSEDKAGNPVYNFMYVDDVFDFLLSIGVKPFVELSFMPEKLASGKTTIFWWKANVTPPKKHERWADLVRATVRHWTERYGEDEVKTWRFEVWNEPDLDVFWDPGKKTTMLDAYLELYKHTARAVKSVNRAYPVGGPSGAGLDFIAPLVKYCRKNRLPLDFISFHQYGFDPENPALPKIDRFGGNYIYLMKNLRHVADCFNKKLEDIRKNLRCDVPVYITEWHASPSPVDPVHDSYFAAPFILEQLRNTEALGRHIPFSRKDAITGIPVGKRYRLPELDPRWAETLFDPKVNQEGAVFDIEAPWSMAKLMLQSEWLS